MTDRERVADTIERLKLDEHGDQCGARLWIYDKGCFAECDCGVPDAVELLGSYLALLSDAEPQYPDEYWNARTCVCGDDVREHYAKGAGCTGFDSDTKRMPPLLTDAEPDVVSGEPDDTGGET
jgi:hypothetical protein